MTAKQVKLKGIVTEEVVCNENQSKYKINSNGMEYAVISTGRQSVKDNLFIRKGEHMEIEGKQNLSEGCSKQIKSEKSRIILRSRGK